MPKLIDLTGSRFNRLLVVGRAGASNYGQPKWAALCDCGNLKTYFGNSLRTGASQSCGCLQQEAITTHGKSKTREFTIWQMMLQRCNNKNHVSYPSYGGRGILVCPEWAESFPNFLSDMGAAPTKSHTLDRINNELGYSKENCAWKTPLEQGKNKRNNRLITANNQTLHLKEWARILGTGKSTITNRLNRGMSEHDAINAPISRKRDRVSGEVN